jgi:predicted nucleotidyltransferase
MGEKMNWIRLQTEKDRIKRFKKVTNEQTKKYYGVLEQFSKLLEIRKTRTQNESEFKQITDRNQCDEDLMAILEYVTKFMRKVIENGSDFNQNHLFILLLHLTPEQITQDTRYFLKVLLT